MLTSSPSIALTNLFLILMLMAPVLGTLTTFSYNLIDLYGISFVTFDDLSSHWTISTQVSPAAKTYSCASNYVMGSLVGFTPNDVYKKIYTSLPPHDMIYYTVRVFALDDWLAGDTILIEVDGVTLVEWEPYYTIQAEGASICRAASNDALVSFVGKLDHTSTSDLGLFISSSITSGSLTASFGIREVRMSFVYKKPTDIHASCVKMQQRTTALGCVCEDGYTEDPSNPGQCIPCSASCAQCFGPGNDKCYSCKAGYFFDGNSCVSCASNCDVCTGPNPNHCIYCSSASFMYWDQTCRLTPCNPPFIQDITGDLRLCKTPCQASNEYLMWDGSCSTTCSNPFVERIEGTAKFCDYPCNQLANEYLLWNGTCSTTCSFYQRQQNGYNFCDACQPNYFMYLNNTCLSTCISPYQQSFQLASKFCDKCQPGYFMYPNDTCLPACASPPTQRIEGGSAFCDNPCSEGEMYYFQKNSECKSTCSYPFEIQDLFFCNINLSEEDINQANNFADILKITNKMNGLTAIIAGIISGGDPGPFCIATLSAMLQYIRYLKIKYPPELQYILDQDNSPLFDIVPEAPEIMAKELPHRTLPEKFEEYGLESSFLLYFWQPGLRIIAVLVGVLLSSIVTSLTEGVKILNPFFRNIKSTLKWNFTIMLWISYSEEIVMATSFELRTAGFESSLAIMSFVFCIIIDLIAVIVFFKMINIIRTLWNAENKANHNSRNHRTMRHHLNKYKVLFNENKEDTFFQQLFLCLFTLKVYLFYVVIAFLFDHPRVQILFLTLLSLIMVLYLLISRPLKSKFDLVQYIIQETIILIVNICTSILSFFDLAGVDAYEDRRRIGEVIIGLNLAFNIFGALFILSKLASNILSIFKKIRNAFRKKKQISNLNTQEQITMRDSHLPSPPRVQARSIRPKISRPLVLNQMINPISEVNLTIHPPKTMMIGNKDFYQNSSLKSNLPAFSNLYDAIEARDAERSTRMDLNKNNLGCILKASKLGIQSTIYQNPSQKSLNKLERKEICHITRNNTLIDKKNVNIRANSNSLSPHK